MQSFQPHIHMHLLHPDHLQNAIKAGLLVDATNHIVTFCHDAVQHRFLDSLTPFFQGRYKYEIRIRRDDQTRDQHV